MGERSEDSDIRYGAFHRAIAELKEHGLPSWERGGNIPWAEVPEATKLEVIEHESTIWSPRQGCSTPGVVALDAIEREVDYGGLRPAQRSVLEDLRRRVDAGEIGEALPNEKDLAGMMLARAVGIGGFDEGLSDAKAAEGGGWDGLRDDMKARLIVDLAVIHGPPGSHALAAIEREVNYGGLSPERRAGLDAVRSGIESGELAGENPNPLYLGDRVGLALRLAELGGRIADDREIGLVEFGGRVTPWGELPERHRFELVMRNVEELTLGTEPAAYALVARSVDLYALPEDARLAFERAQANVAEGRWPDAEEEPRLRDATRNLTEAVFLDAWPRNAAVVDFGLDSQAHYEALYYPLRSGEITPVQLDAALGSGEKLTALARASPSNPHPGIVFQTAWDDLAAEPWGHRPAGPDDGGGAPSSPGEIARFGPSPAPGDGANHDRSRGR